MRVFRDGEPCDHPGCLSHLSHPCEGCGRIGGISGIPFPPPPLASLHTPNAFGINPVPLESLGSGITPDIEVVEAPLNQKNSREQLMALKSVQIEVGEFVYYTLHELAVLFHIPAYYIRAALRKSGIPARCINKVEIIDGESFHNWIMSGNLNEYTPRKNRKHSIDRDIEISRKFIERRMVIE